MVLIVGVLGKKLCDGGDKIEHLVFQGTGTVSSSCGRLLEEISSERGYLCSG